MSSAIKEREEASLLVSKFICSFVLNVPVDGIQAWESLTESNCLLIWRGSQSLVGGDAQAHMLPTGLALPLSVWRPLPALLLPGSLPPPVGSSLTWNSQEQHSQLGAACSCPQTEENRPPAASSGHLSAGSRSALTTCLLPIQHGFQWKVKL